MEFGAGGASSCKRRLTLLYHHGLLDRVHLPLRGAYGASKAVYCLDQKGAEHLARSQRRPRGELAWRSRDRDREELFLEHTLDTNDVRIAFTLACRWQGLTLDWVDEAALRRMDVLERLRGPRGDAVTLLPDAYFTVLRDSTVDGFALEVDRSTVSERRMRARIRAYGEWAASGRYRRKLPAESLRVLFAVTDCARDARRLEHLKSWAEEEGGRSLFWFIDRDGLDEDVLTAPAWRVAGRVERLALPLGGGGR
jgi:hypothetical protein